MLPIQKILLVANLAPALTSRNNRVHVIAEIWQQSVNKTNSTKKCVLLLKMYTMNITNNKQIFKLTQNEKIHFTFNKNIINIKIVLKNVRNY